MVADKKQAAPEQEAESNSSRSTATRRIRKVDTVREKAEKNAAASDKPRRFRKSRRAATAPLRVIGLGFTELGKFKPFHILGLIIFPRYFRNSWKELRQVTWPTGRESRRLTLAVILFASIFGILVAIVDFGLDKAFKQVLLK